MKISVGCTYALAVIKSVATFNFCQILIRLGGLLLSKWNCLVQRVHSFVFHKYVYYIEFGNCSRGITYKLGNNLLFTLI